MTQSVEDRPRSGRPKIYTDRDERNLVNMVKRDRRAPSHVVAADWDLANGRHASASTVRRRLLAHNLKWRAAAKKPRLTVAHKAARRDFCQGVRYWQPIDWHRVIFTDEMNIEVDSRKNRIMLIRTPAEKYNPDCIDERTRQGSGSVGIWACMSYNGIGIFEIYGGRLNQWVYIEILGNNLLPSIDLLQEPGIRPIIQQDNAPCHTAHSVQEWFAEQEIDRLPWPPNSPYLNCIENLWSWLDAAISKESPRNLDELKAAVVKCLNNVPQHVYRDLVDSMPNRINECLRNNGGITRY